METARNRVRAHRTGDRAAEEEKDMQGLSVLAIDAMDVFGVLAPAAFLVLIAAFVIGVRSSGTRRTKERVGEAELREGTFTGAERATLEWPRSRRKPTLAEVLRIAEMYGYRLTDREDADDVVVLRFERVHEDD